MPQFCTGDWSPSAHICNLQLLKLTLTMEILADSHKIAIANSRRSFTNANQWARKLVIPYSCVMVNSLFWGRPAWNRGLGDAVGQARFGERRETTTGEGNADGSVSVSSGAGRVMEQLQAWRGLCAALHWAVWLYQLREVLIQDLLMLHCPGWRKSGVW